MNTKLTLNLNSKVITRAKKYANSKETSLSKLVESYFDSITSREERGRKVSSLVGELSGIVKLPRNFDYKKERRTHILKKYS